MTNHNHRNILFVDQSTADQYSQKMKTRQSEQAFVRLRDSLRTQKMLRTKFPTIWTYSSLNFDYVVVFSLSLLKYDLFHVFRDSQNFTCSAFSPTGYFRREKRTYSDLIMKQEQITALQRLRFRFFKSYCVLIVETKQIHVTQLYVNNHSWHELCLFL